MARKETAKQRRARKERERAQRLAYERGEIPAGVPKSKTARQKHEQQRREIQRDYARFLTRSAAETSRMNAGDVRAEVSALHDIAYDRYRTMMKQGTPSAGTVQYENDFAGINVDAMSINELRAYASKFRHWLQRKDIIPKRAAALQRKQLQFLRKQGIDNPTPADLDRYFDLFSKYRQTHKGQSIGSPQIAQAFAMARAANMTMQQALTTAEKEIEKAYERNVRNAGFASPLDVGTGVQPAKFGQFSVRYPAFMHMDTTPKNRKQRRQAKEKRR